MKRKKTKVLQVLFLMCFFVVFVHANLVMAKETDEKQLDIFRKSEEYREMYRLPEEQKVELTPSGRLNINFYKIDLRKALREIGEKAGITVAIDKKVTGEVTLKVREVTFEEALDAILSDTNYMFRKVDNVYLVEPKLPPPKAPPEELLPPGERPITNMFVDTDIREILRTIGAQAEVNILYDDSVRGYVSVDLKEVPLEKALEIICAPGGYTFTYKEGYYLVGSPHPTSPAFQNLSKTEEIQLKYIEAQSVSSLLSDFFRPYVKIDAKRNILLVSGPPEIIARIKEDVQKIDQPRKQVMIEAVITELSKEKGKELGMDWGWYWLPSQIAEANELEGVEVSDLQIGYTSRVVGEIFANLKALVKEGRAEIKATPRVSALDGENAEINVEREEYYVILAGPPESPYLRFETISVGVSLNILPRVVGENEIMMSISPKVSDVVQREEREFPTVSRRTVQTTVRVKDGQTIIIGGLLQNIERQLSSGVPFLRKIPILDLFFGRKTSSSQETELVVFITPHIVQ